MALGHSSGFAALNHAHISLSAGLLLLMQEDLKELEKQGLDNWFQSPQTSLGFGLGSRKLGQKMAFCDFGKIKKALPSCVWTSGSMDPGKSLNMEGTCHPPAHAMHLTFPAASGHPGFCSDTGHCVI